MPNRDRSSCRSKLTDEEDDEKIFESWMLARRNCGELYEDCIEFSNGDQYLGQLKNGLMHGRGKYLWANGDKYSGEWKNGMMHGQGKKFQMETCIRRGKLCRKTLWAQ